MSSSRTKISTSALIFFSILLGAFSLLSGEQRVQAAASNTASDLEENSTIVASNSSGSEVSASEEELPESPGPISSSPSATPVVSPLPSSPTPTVAPSPVVSASPLPSPSPSPRPSPQPPPIPEPKPENEKKDEGKNNIGGVIKENPPSQPQQPTAAPRTDIPVATEVSDIGGSDLQLSEDDRDILQALLNPNMSNETIELPSFLETDSPQSRYNYQYGLSGPVSTALLASSFLAFTIAAALGRKEIWHLLSSFRNSLPQFG